jgi:DNA-directed RNA polymerase specialized sigma24 family protein
VERLSAVVPGSGASQVDQLFRRVCDGDPDAFEAWMVRVEVPLRKSLAPWARAVDVESVMQETLLRVWGFALERGHTLEGENASLRWACGVARNVARSEARRFRRETFMPPGELPEPPAEPAPPPDPALRRIIRACQERLPRRPREALQSRLVEGHARHDRSLAQALGMTLNTFRQNIVRARKKMAECLRENGAPIEEVLP